METKVFHNELDSFLGWPFVTTDVRIFCSKVLWKIPSNFDFDKAAALAVSYGTAYVGLTRKGNTKPGYGLANTWFIFVEFTSSESTITFITNTKPQKDWDISWVFCKTNSRWSTYILFITEASISFRQTVLVTAAAGALGLATVDIAANALGAKVSLTNKFWKMQKHRNTSSNNTNSSIRMYSLRDFIWMVTPLGFVWQIRIGGFLFLVKFAFGRGRG